MDRTAADTARYFENSVQVAAPNARDFGAAREYYRQAQRLRPADGWRTGVRRRKGAKVGRLNWRTAWWGWRQWWPHDGWWGTQATPTTNWPCWHRTTTTASARSFITFWGAASVRPTMQEAPQGRTDGRGGLIPRPPCETEGGGRAGGGGRALTTPPFKTAAENLRLLFERRSHDVSRLIGPAVTLIAPAAIDGAGVGADGATVDVVDVRASVSALLQRLMDVQQGLFVVAGYVWPRRRPAAHPRYLCSPRAALRT